MNKEVYHLHAEMCKTFSNSTRLEILHLLREGELTVSDLIKKTGLSQANVSQHLSIMKNRGILQSRRKGLHICYQLANPKIIEAFDIIREILTARLKQSKKLVERWGNE